jgi:L-ribulose-5-phosphate 3-epimerase
VLPRARFGVYEKALPPESHWTALLDLAASAGYGFVELAIDETEERMQRLRWTPSQRASLRSAIAQSGVPVRTWILSAHRRTPLGSADRATRAAAIEMLRRCIDLAVDVGVRLVQLAGYFVYHEAHDAGSRRLFVEGVRLGLEHAAPAGVMLGLETMDGEDIVSVRSAMEVVREIGSPWLGVYPDVGNLAANGLDVAAELRLGRGHLVGVHLKDTRPGEYRRVPFGEGCVPFAAVFATLAETGYDGPYVVEMWNDGDPDALGTAENARRWLLEQAARVPLMREPRQLIL